MLGVAAESCSCCCTVQRRLCARGMWWCAVCHGRVLYVRCQGAWRGHTMAETHQRAVLSRDPVAMASSHPTVFTFHTSHLYCVASLATATRRPLFASTDSPGMDGQVHAVCCREACTAARHTTHCQDVTALNLTAQTDDCTSRRKPHSLLTQ